MLMATFDLLAPLHCHIVPAQQLCQNIKGQRELTFVDYLFNSRRILRIVAKMESTRFRASIDRPRTRTMVVSSIVLVGLATTLTAKYFTGSNLNDFRTGMSTQHPSTTIISTTTILGMYHLF